MVRIKELSKILGKFRLKNISFEVDKGEYFVLLGRSGAGKTVLLELISGLLEPDHGKIFINNKEMTNERIQKRNIGLVYQDQALFPHLTVRGNIAYPLKCRGMKRSEINKNVKNIAMLLDIAFLLDRKPETLSLGQGQRVAIARALATSPECLLLDEPLSSLDVQAKQEIRSLLRRINLDGRTIIHVTHDYEEAISLASKVAIIEGNSIAQVGTPEEVFRHPRSQFVARFIGVRNFYRGELRKVSGNSALFYTGGLEFHILTEEEAGKGFLLLRSEDIILSNSRQKTSARNNFKGRVTDIENLKNGVEVTVDIGMDISALITRDSFKKLGIGFKKGIFISFKASAARFIRE
jgi:molybdopterin-binding protein